MNASRTIARNLFLSKNCIGLIKYRHKVHCIDHWSCRVPPLHEGTLAVVTAYNVNIEPVDVNSAAGVNEKALISLYVRTENEELVSKIRNNLRQYLKCEKQLAFDEQRKTCKLDVLLNGKTLDIDPKDVSLDVRVPYHFSVKVNSKQSADVHIKGLEGKTYDISSSGSGNCYLKALKGQSIKCVTGRGSIACDSYLLCKNGSLVTRNKGSIYVNKLQGGNFLLRTEHGKINVSAIYLEKIKVESQLGNVKLGDTHGVSELVTGKGNITVGSVKGSLHAATATGSIDAFMAEHENVELRTDKGDITVKMGNSVSSELIVEAKDIHVDPDLRLKDECYKDGHTSDGCWCTSRLTAKVVADGGSQPRIVKVEARLGQAKLEKTDWFSSLKLKV